MLAKSVALVPVADFHTDIVSGLGDDCKARIESAGRRKFNKTEREAWSTRYKIPRAEQAAEKLKTLSF